MRGKSNYTDLEIANEIVETLLLHNSEVNVIKFLISAGFSKEIITQKLNFDLEYYKEAAESYDIDDNVVAKIA